MRESLTYKSDRIYYILFGLYSSASCSGAVLNRQTGSFDGVFLFTLWIDSFSYAFKKG